LVDKTVGFLIIDKTLFFWVEPQGPTETDSDLA
jgi:hypothetical protein